MGRKLTRKRQQKHKKRKKKQDNSEKNKQNTAKENQKNNSIQYTNQAQPKPTGREELREKIRERRMGLAGLRRVGTNPQVNKFAKNASTEDLTQLNQSVSSLDSSNAKPSSNSKNMLNMIPEDQIGQITKQLGSAGYDTSAIQNLVQGQKNKKNNEDSLIERKLRQHPTYTPATNRNNIPEINQNENNTPETKIETGKGTERENGTKSEKENEPSQFDPIGIKAQQLIRGGNVPKLDTRSLFTSLPSPMDI
jgi:hypothetical protein